MLGRLPFATLAILAMVLSLLIADTVNAAPMPAPKPAKTSISLKQLTEAFAGNCPQETVGEAITCKDALPFINTAIKKYGLKTRGQRAAYIATMAYEGAYLKYNHNLVNHSQGTRSIMPAVSLRRFVDANKCIQGFWPGFPNNVDDNTIVDVLINHHVDFEPGAWWTVSGPGCTEVASRLGGSQESFVAWEKTCINGGVDTIPQRAAIYNTVYAAIQ